MSHALTVLRPAQTDAALADVGRDEEVRRLVEAQQLLWNHKVKTGTIAL
jgi:hypothetical protein